MAIARDLVAGSNSAALSSRPHEPIMSQTFGLGIGTQPMSERLKRMRTAALKSVARPMWSLLDPAVDYQSRVLESDLKVRGQDGAVSLDPFPLVQKLTMNLSLQITYGVQMDSTEDSRYQSILKQAAAVTRIQTVTQVWANFIPILMWTPKVRRDIKLAKEAQAYRVAYQADLFSQLVKKIGIGKPPACIAASLLEDREAKLNQDEIDAICRAMLQGGVETIAGSLVGGLGSLSTLAGQKIQATAYRAILDEYGDANAAWADAFSAEKVPYLSALYKECLRFYTVSASGLPHETMRDVNYGCSTIPKGTIVYFNNEAINHDDQFYGDGNVFRPERWLEEPLISTKGLTHVAYGPGPRICPALHISNHIMYAVLMRLILDYRIIADEKAPPVTDGIFFGPGVEGLNKTPYPFKLYFKPRDENAVKRINNKESAGA
ncbi:hypothetical protein LTR10_018870 [Elasticomyces elasticus]|uniref:Cytochrome P450 n=1 Tax=Exophiala sideris TaxID=1016849 RepID=A0ABR0IXI8_9EURO|nr:hypothetical protein LTR10_018870 [Elasticomyces elasticus]KAK5021669.1 hypothetical protein LTS07_010840 [Exophiala sideris]KAK5049807.1 hypothetical protein LTR69_010864 [Exophiala sideris]KAK5176788.1 hypothetical protein LTR44_010731 [Eurotiomycetes sp. CCFEE 6388]